MSSVWLEPKDSLHKKQFICLLKQDPCSPLRNVSRCSLPVPLIGWMQWGEKYPARFRIGFGDYLQGPSAGGQWGSHRRILMGRILGHRTGKGTHWITQGFLGRVVGVSQDYADTSAPELCDGTRDLGSVSKF